MSEVKVCPNCGADMLSLQRSAVGAKWECLICYWLEPGSGEAKTISDPVKFTTVAGTKGRTAHGGK